MTVDRSSARFGSDAMCKQSAGNIRLFGALVAWLSMCAAAGLDCSSRIGLQKLGQVKCGAIQKQSNGAFVDFSAQKCAVQLRGNLTEGWILA